MKTGKKIIISTIFGAITGFINGFFGGGGGMVAVPVLTNFLSLGEKEAHATSIAVILPLTIISSIIYFLKLKIDYVNLEICSVGIFIGGIAGAIILKKINNKVLGYIFTAVMLFAGIRMLF